ncbi:DUF4381 domain-containing protein [Salinimonas marina]|uniref:DUF4381 domain-containing protein n=1 Tax=Salinimonas marina TaxID=2785918 RepID=A0A7S9DVR5_9ALTE|nr:DUF4381 domain-containing protein [Salinimonas marina]
MNEQQLLAQLKDIQPPDPVSFWPLAWGWWLVVALTLLVLTAVVWWWRQRRRFNAPAARRSRSLKMFLWKPTTGRHKSINYSSVPPSATSPPCPGGTVWSTLDPVFGKAAQTGAAEPGRRGTESLTGYAVSARQA